MRGTVAKRLRREVYGDLSLKIPRQYQGGLPTRKLVRTAVQTLANLLLGWSKRKDIKPEKEDIILHSMTTVVNHPASPRARYQRAKRVHLNGAGR